METRHLTHSASRESKTVDRPAPVSGIETDDSCECWDDPHHVAAGTLCERCQDEIGPEHYAATRRQATVDELVAERLQAVEDIAGMLAECRPTWSIQDHVEGPSDPREREIGLFSREARSLVLKAVEMHYSGHRWAEWASSEVWEAASDDDRGCMTGFLHAIRFIPEGHEVTTDTGASEFFGDFVTLCLQGSPVKFPLSPLDPDDLDRMATIYEDTTECETRQPASPSGSSSRASSATSWDSSSSRDQDTDECERINTASRSATASHGRSRDSIATGIHATSSASASSLCSTTSTIANRITSSGHREIQMASYSPRTSYRRRHDQDTTESETCNTQPSGHALASSPVTSRAGTPISSLANAALAALSNAPNSETTNVPALPDREAGRHRILGVLAGAQVARTDRPIEADHQGRGVDDLPHGTLRSGSASGMHRPNLGYIPPHPGQREGHRVDPIGIMIDGYIAYMDAFDSDGLLKDSLEQVDQPSTYLPEDRRNSFDANQAHASTKVDPGFHPIHPSPLDCADVLALRAFGAC